MKKVTDRARESTVGEEDKAGYSLGLKATMADIMDWCHVLQYFYCDKDE